MQGRSADPAPTPVWDLGDSHENALAETMVGLSKTQVPSHGHVRAFARGEALRFAPRDQTCGFFVRWS